MISASVKERIRKWAETEEYVASAYIFGSRARNDYKTDSDLDVAVELNPGPGDTGALATWIFEAKKLQKRLQKQVPEFKIDLQLLDGDETEIVTAAIERSSYKVY